MELSWSDPEEIRLDPALLADPGVVLARTLPSPRVRRPPRAPRPRPFVLRGPIDPATEAWPGTKPAGYVHVGPSPLRRIAAAAMIVIVGSGLGVAIAGGVPL